MAHDFAEDRAQLTTLQARILRRIRTLHWLGKPRRWPTTQEIFIEFGKAEAVAAIQALPSGALASAGGQLGMSLLGLLLSDEGARVEQFLDDYLHLAKAQSRRDPRSVDITSEQMHSAHDMTDEELDLTAHAIERGILHDGINFMAGPRWSFRRPADIADLVAMDDFHGYLRDRAFAVATATSPSNQEPRLHLGRTQVQLPTSRGVEEKLRSLVDESAFRARHPAAYVKWAEAERLLWTGDPAASATIIGHLCREAHQEFVTSLLTLHPTPGAPESPALTKNRAGAVLRNLGISSEKVSAAAETLLAHWGTVIDLAQRQEHGALKAGDSLTWEDARRLVFHTLFAMTEIDHVARWSAQ